MDENGNGHVGDDIEKGARAAQQVAKSAATAGKAIGKAAAGDVVGAATDVLKDEGFRRIIAVILISSFLLTFMIFFAAPMALYEGVKGYFDTIRERWLEDYYTSNGSRGIAALKATLSGAWDIIRDGWDAIVSGPPHNDSGRQDTDEMSPADIQVMGPRDALESVYEKKIDACVEKLDARADMILSAIRASVNAPATNPGTVNGWVYSNLFLARDYPSYAALPDTRNVTYRGVTLSEMAQPMSRRAAVRCIAIYSAMYNSTPEMIKPYALMKWLGYYNGSAPDVSFVVGDAVYCSVKGWSGDFLPMYLLEEMQMNKKQDYSRYMCPAADVLLVVTSDPLAYLEPSVSKTEIPHIETRTGYGLQWRLMSNETYQSWPFYNVEITTEGNPGVYFPYCTDNYQRWQYYRGPLDYEGMCAAYAAGELVWCQVYDWYTYQITVIEYDYELTYSFNAGVTVRDPKTIYKLAGFYERPNPVS